MPATTGDHLAVLIDADNVSAKHVVGLMAEVANYGTASVRRIYGDFTASNMRSWNECLLEHSIVPVQQFAYTSGKNATDGAMIIDAMDLLYTNRFKGFCLVSSDSDFTRLAARIREQGIAVYGFGNRHNTSRAFVAACNEFVYFDALTGPQVEQAPSAALSPQTPAKLSANDKPSTSELPIRIQSTPGRSTGPPGRSGASTAPFSNDHGPLPRPPHVEPTPKPLDRAAKTGLVQAIMSCNPYTEDWVNLADVGLFLTRISPDLKARNYGYQRLSEFVKASGIVEFKFHPMGSAPPIALVRLVK